MMGNDQHEHDKIIQFKDSCAENKSVFSNKYAIYKSIPSYIKFKCPHGEKLKP